MCFKLLCFPTNVTESQTIRFFIRDKLESIHKCIGQRKRAWRTPPHVWENKERSAPQWRLGRDKSGLEGLHNGLAKERSPGACMSTRAVGCSLEGSARNLELKMQRVFRRKTSQASGGFRLVSTEKHAAQAGDPPREL